LVGITGEEKALISKLIRSKAELENNDKRILEWCQDELPVLSGLTQEQRHYVMDILCADSDLELHISELKEQNDKESQKELLKLTYHSDNWIRYMAFETLNQQDDSHKAVERNKEGIEDEDELIRTECAEQLGDVGEVGAVKKLYDLISKDSSSLVKASAITSIAQIVYSLVEDLDDRYSALSTLEKTSAALFLYSIGMSNYLDEIKKLIENADDEVRCRVVNGIKNFDYFFEPSKLKVFIDILKSKKSSAVSAEFQCVIEDAIDELERSLTA